MKQTNNAIKFLMAQYRAIFKQAYIKGLVSAVVLTTGLATAGNANADQDAIYDNAAAITTDATKLEKKDLHITINGLTTSNGTAGGAGTEKDPKTYTKLQIVGSGSDLVDKTWNANLVIMGGAVADNYISAKNDAKSGDVSFSGAGSLIIKTGTPDNGLTVTTSGSAFGIGLDIGTIDVQTGALSITNDSSENGKSVTVTADNITIGTADGEPGSAVVTLTGDDKKIATLGDASSTLTINNGGKIVLNAKAAATTANIVAKTITATGGIITTTGTTVKGGSITTGVGEFTGTTFDVSGGTELNVNTDSILLKDSTLKNAGTLNFVAKGTEGIIVEGTTTLSGTTSFTDSNVKISPEGTFKVPSAKSGGISLVGTNKAATLEISSASAASLLKVGYLNLSGSNGKAASATVNGDLTLASIKDSGTAIGDVALGANSSLNVTGKLTLESSTAVTVDLKKDDGSVSVSADTLNLKAPKNVTVQSGEFIFNSMTSENGALTIAADGTVKLGKTDTESPSVLSAATTVNGGKLIINKDVEVSKGLTLSDGSIDIKNSAVTLTGDTKLSAAKGTLTLSGTENKRASLDLTGKDAFDVKGSNSDIPAIKVNDYATLTVTSEDLSKVKTDKTKALITVTGANAVLKSTGNLNTTGDFTSTTNTTDGVVLTGGGTLATDTLTVSGGNSLSFGDGNIKTSDLVLTADTDLSDKTTGALSVSNQISAQTAAAAAGATATNLTVNGGKLNLDAESGKTGKVMVNLNQKGGTVNVLGTWKADTNDVIVDGGTFNVGEDTETPRASSLSATKFTQNGGTVNVVNASLTTKELSSAGTFNIKNASVTADKFGAKTGMTVSNGGLLTINGVPETTTQAEANKKPEKFDQDTYLGVSNLNGTIAVNGGKVVIGETVVAGMFNNFENGWTDADYGKADKHLVSKNIGKFDLSNNGILSLTFKDGDTLSTVALKQIKNELMGATNGVSYGGTLDIGKAQITGFEIKDNKLTWEDYLGVVNGNEGSLGNTVNDQLKNTAVTGATGEFTGNIGSIQLDKGQTGINITGEANNLWNASAAGNITGGNFVSTYDGKAASVTLTSGANLGLVGTGALKDVTLTAGTEENETTLTLRAKDGADNKITLNSITTSGEKVENSGLVVEKNVAATVNGDIKVAGINLSGNLTSTNKKGTAVIDTTNLTSTEGSVLTADYLNLGVKGDGASVAPTTATAAALGNITVNKNMTVVAAAKDPVDGYSAKFGGIVDVKGDLDATNASFGKTVTVGNKLTATGSEFAGDVKISQDLNSTGSRFASGVVVENDLTASNSQFLKDVSAKTVNVSASNDLTPEDPDGWAPTLFRGALKADKITVTGSDVTAPAARKLVRAELIAEGTLKTKTVELSNADLTVAGGTAEIDTLTGTNGGDLAVGNVGIADFADTADFDEGKNYTGLAVVNNAENVSLAAHTGYDLASATIVVKHLGSKGSSDEVLSREVIVGQNGVIGLSTDADTLNRVVAAFRDGDRFAQQDPDQDGYSALIYAHKNITVKQGGSLVMTAGAADSDVNSSLKSFYAMQNGARAYFGANTVLVLNADAFKRDGAGNALSYITFEGDSATLVADGGEISIIGDSMRDEYKIFGLKATQPQKNNAAAPLQDIGGGNDNGGSDDSDSGTDNTPAAGSINIVDLYNKEASITVRSSNGLLTGELTSNSKGTVEMHVDENVAPSVITGVSHPVYDTVLAYARGYNGEYVKNPAMPDDVETAAEGDAEAPVVPDWLYSYDKNGNKVYDYNNELLTRVVFAGASASDVERVARLGVYGGAAQAALTANTTTFDAVSGRMGVGASQGNITFSDNGQGAGMWLAPVYRNHDSDGFAAQGLSYGVDMDLSGVALGGDFTTAGGLRMGAALNVGSGDAKGQGAATGVKNDFDYYGFAVYGGYTAGNLSVVADVTYTKADNDVETDTIVGKVAGSIDSTAISVGVTGQYTIAMNGFDLAPHAGLRYTNLKLDDYQADLNGAELVGFEGDTLNVFSIPVGFSVSKNIVSGAWTIKPAFDLTLTANFGDDELDGKTGWAGVENLDTKTTTEILDSFTYGATLGVSAKTGNFSFGLGLNYTGASNADEYGVNANARFVF